MYRQPSLFYGLASQGQVNGNAMCVHDRMEK